MDTLIVNCTDALSQPNTPTCATDYGERVVRVAFMKEGGTFAVAASDVPTAAEFETAIAANEITVYNGISNGHRIEQGATELSGDDTETGGTERWDVEYRVEGRIKRVDENIARSTEILDRFSDVRMWFFTEKDYCFGGITGYKVAPNFSEVILEGKGNPPYISFFCDYTAIGADYAGYDTDYSLLDNT